MRVFRGALGVGALAVLAAALGSAAGSWRGPLALLIALALAAALAVCARAAAPGLLALPRRRFLLGLAAAAAALRLAWVAAVPTGPVSDFAIYHELAVALASGQGYATTGPVGVAEDLTLYLGGKAKTLPYATSYRPPGVPFLGAALYRAFGVNPLWMKLLDAALAAATCVLLYLALAGAGWELEARLVAIAWAVYPTSIFATSLFGSEVPFTAALACLAWLLNSPRGYARWAALGLAGGAACLIRPLAGPLAASVALAAALDGRWRARAKGLALAALVAAAAVSPWAWRNTRLWGRPTGLSTETGIILAFNTGRLLPDAAAAEVDARARAWAAQPNESLQESQGYALARQNMLAVLRAGPRYALSKLPCLGDTFGDDLEIARWATVGADRRPVVPPWALRLVWALSDPVYLAICALAILGLWRRRGAWPALPAGAALLLSFFLVMLAAFSVIPGQPRYHFPLMPALFWLAALGAGGPGKHQQPEASRKVVHKV